MGWHLLRLRTSTSPLKNDERGRRKHESRKHPEAGNRSCGEFHPQAPQSCHSESISDYLRPDRKVGMTVKKMGHDISIL